MDTIEKTLKPAKREAILRAALAVFLEYGYGHATVDEIVRRAGGSKATVYKYFEDKEKLFTLVVDDLVRNRAATDLEIESSPREGLLAYAISRLKVVFSDEHIALRRLIIGESARFPEIALTYYEHGPELSRGRLSRFFSAESTRKKLNIDSPDAAAMLFQGMLMHSFYVETLFKETPTLSDRQIRQHAEVVVEKFLKIYT